jgi:hypothetical protein
MHYTHCPDMIHMLSIFSLDKPSAFPVRVQPHYLKFCSIIKGTLQCAFQRLWATLPIKVRCLQELAGYVRAQYMNVLDGRRHLHTNECIRLTCQARHRPCSTYAQASLAALPTALRAHCCQHLPACDCWPSPRAHPLPLPHTPHPCLDQSGPHRPSPLALSGPVRFPCWSGPHAAPIRLGTWRSAV